MEKVVLGRTGLSASRTAFGALPIQRVPLDEAAVILRRAHEGGINFFDTARAYSDSEEKIGHALAPVRGEIILASKSIAQNKAAVLADLETSLRQLKTDYLDIFQLHFVQRLPDPRDPDSLYGAMVEAKARGLIRFIGLTAHRLDIALAAAASGLYDTVQFPLSTVASDSDLGLIEVCREHNVGLIAMKALCGGLLTDAAAAFAFLRQFGNVVPIWGIQRLSELEQFLALERQPPALDEAMRARIGRDRADLAGEFCRGCGYCQPCPAEIPIPTAARMSFLLRRMPPQPWLTEEWQERMARIENCGECGQCRERCPYKLDPPAIMKRMLDDYKTFPSPRT